VPGCVGVVGGGGSVCVCEGACWACVGSGGGVGLEATAGGGEREQRGGRLG